MAQAELAPTTVLFIEIPTNPDMKVPDMAPIAEMLSGYKAKTGKNVVLLIDATFAPGSQTMTKLKELGPELTVMVFISLSKSISRGLTTGGAIVANHTDEAISLLETIRDTAQMLDTTAKVLVGGYCAGPVGGYCAGIVGVLGRGATLSSDPSPPARMHRHAHAVCQRHVLPCSS